MQNTQTKRIIELTPTEINYIVDLLWSEQVTLQNIPNLKSFTTWTKERQTIIKSLLKKLK